jgi:hypothetical protein
MGRWIAVPVAAALLAGLPGVAQAVTLKFDCVERDTPANAAMRLTYDGDESGTLRVEASFGTFMLSATKVEPAGAMTMGIRAFGSASVRMPEQAALEACVRGKASADVPLDDDSAVFFTSGCQQSVAPAPEPVGAAVSIELVRDQGPETQAFLRRTYATPTDGLKSKLYLEALPPPTCMLLP